MAFKACENKEGEISLKYIHVGSEKIPLDDYAISGTAILGIKDSGKTYGAKNIAEQLLDHDIPIIVFDPIGRWRFMKLAGDDHKSPRGFKVVVAGGEEPDLPLTPDNATEIVRAAMRENIPLVVDLYDRKYSKADWRRVVQRCFRTMLYENKGVRHIFLEEAVEFVPQKVMDGETYAEVEKLVRMGGNASLGITLIGQRSQEVNKSVLDLCENIILMRQRGAHAIDAVSKMVEKLSPDEAKAVNASLSKFGAGDCWVMSSEDEAASRTKFGPIRSFHPNRRMPQLSAKATAERRTSTDDFVSALHHLLPKIAEEAKANDPAELKKQIAELRRELAKAQKVPTIAQPSDEQLTAARSAGFNQGATVAGRQLYTANDANQKAVSEILRDAARRISEAMKLPQKLQESPPMDSKLAQIRETARKAKPATPPIVVGKGNGAATEFKTNEQVSRPQQKILDTLWWLQQRGRYPVPKRLLAAMTNVSYKSSAFQNNLGSMRSMGLIDYVNTEVVFQSAGEAMANKVDDDRPTHEIWLEVLSGPQQRILLTLLEHHPKPLDKEKLAELVSVSEKSSAFQNNLGAMRSMGAIDYPTPGMVKASELVIS